MNPKEFTFETSDQTANYAVEWPCSQPKGVLCMVHGLGEHCRRYDPVAEYFNQQKFAMVGYDRKGHGLTEGKRGHVASYDLMQEEIDQLILASRERYPGVPLILYGHSMGGNLVIKYIIDRQPDIKLSIATGPWIQLTIPPPKLKVAAGRIAGRFFPAMLHNTGLDTRHISTDIKEVSKYENDPLVHGKISSATAEAMLDSGTWLMNYSGSLSVPLLLMHGGADLITSPKASRSFVSKVKGDIHYKEWEGAYHEIHNEPNRQEVLEYALTWILERL